LGGTKEEYQPFSVFYFLSFYFSTIVHGSVCIYYYYYYFFFFIELAPEEQEGLDRQLPRYPLLSKIKG
jgi:hypothetical protein